MMSAWKFHTEKLWGWFWFSSSYYVLFISEWQLLFDLFVFLKTLKHFKKKITLAIMVNVSGFLIFFFIVYFLKKKLESVSLKLLQLCYNYALSFKSLSDRLWLCPLFVSGKCNCNELCIIHPQIPYSSRTLWHKPLSNKFQVFSFLYAGCNARLVDACHWYIVLVLNLFH